MCGLRADLECTKPAALHLLTALDPKLLWVEANSALGVAARGRHAHTIIRACMACAVDLGEPFDRLINRRLTNLMVGHMTDEYHRKPP